MGKITTAQGSCHAKNAKVFPAMMFETMRHEQYRAAMNMKMFCLEKLRMKTPSFL